MSDHLDDFRLRRRRKLAGCILRFEVGSFAELHFDELVGA